MGVTTAAARFFAEARRDHGVRFDRTLMLGHQVLFANPLGVHRHFTRANAWAGPEAKGRFLADVAGAQPYADPLFRALGASVVHAMDASPYEGADVVHDLNEELPPELAERYSVVFDGGTLEHVFNLPTALRSTMEMVEPGGHLIAGVVANNEFGHGFYQFSPELFFRALSPENGFRVERVVAFEAELEPRRFLGLHYPYERLGPLHEVRDELRHEGRHVLISSKPVELLVLAQRVERRPIFATWPQQSDYAASWEAGRGDPPDPAAPPPQPTAPPEPGGVRSAIRRRLPPREQTIAWYAAAGAIAWLRRPLDALERRRNVRRTSLSNPRLYPPARPGARRRPR